MKTRPQRQPLLGDLIPGEDEIDEDVEEDVEPDENYVRTPSKVGLILAARSEPSFYHESHGGGGGDHGEDCVDLPANDTDWTFLNGASFNMGEDAIELPSPAGGSGPNPSGFVLNDLVSLGFPDDKTITHIKVSFQIKSLHLNPPDGNGFILFLDQDTEDTLFSSPFFINVSGSYQLFETEFVPVSHEFPGDLPLKLWFLHTAGAVATYFLKDISICARW